MVSARQFLASSIFANPEKIADLDSGRSWLSLADITGISDMLAVPVLPTLLALFVKPDYTPPDWLPILPFTLDNPVDPTSWVSQEGTTPQDPRDDSFYHPDISTYENKQNGDVLDIREVGLASIWVNINKAYQISYRTESALGWPQADITTVMIPNNANGKVVSYQMWEDSCSLQCSPSYSVLTGVSDPTIDILLVLGFTVNFPDHEGKNSSFGAGLKEGKSTLDSMKAFLSAREQIGLDTNSYDKIVMWGYSGGSIATGHAVELMSEYASGLASNVVGGIMGGVIANLTSVIDVMNGGIFAGFGAAGMWGLGTEYPGLQAVVDEHLRPGLKWRFNYVGQRCIVANLLNMIFQNVWGYTTDSTGAELMDDPRVYEVLDDNLMGAKNSPVVPMMVYNGVQDEIADIYQVDRTVDSYCKAGAKVDYFRISLLGHVGAELLPIIECLEYVYKFFDGYVPASCSDVADATKATTVYYQDKPDAYNDLVDGNFESAGVYDKLKQDGYYQG